MAVPSLEISDLVAYKHNMLQSKAEFVPKTRDHTFDLLWPRCFLSKDAFCFADIRLQRSSLQHIAHKLRSDSPSKPSASDDRKRATSDSKREMPHEPWQVHPVGVGPVSDIIYTPKTLKMISCVTAT